MPTSVELADFRKNNITTLESVHSQLYEVKELRLDYNQIHAIQPKAFVYFRKLVLLSVTHNRLIGVGSFSFAGLSNLEFLLLDNNFVTSVESGLLADLQRLQVLTLHSNNLEHLNIDFQLAVHELPSLTDLTLFNNPWNCTHLCDNATFKHWLLNHSHFISNLTVIHCQQLNVSSLVVAVPDNYFRCFDKTLLLPVAAGRTSMAVFLLSLASAGVALLVLFVGILYRRSRHIINVQRSTLAETYLDSIQMEVVR
jgi:hypothetical protein